MLLVWSAGPPELDKRAQSSFLELKVRLTAKQRCAPGHESVEAT